MAYLGVWGETSYERVIERSRFLAYCARTASEEEAKAYLETLRAGHAGATHVCYGYVADSLGNLQRFSDDGEPQGTAGMPILGVIKAQSLRETTVAVVRWFGGIKLGAGGLTRAYSSLSAECIRLAPKRSFELCAELAVSVGYGETGACLRYLEGHSVTVKDRLFATGAEFRVLVKACDEAAFTRDLLGALNGRVTVRKIASYIHPFELAS